MRGGGPRRREAGGAKAERSPEPIEEEEIRGSGIKEGGGFRERRAMGRGRGEVGGSRKGTEGIPGGTGDGEDSDRRHRETSPSRTSWVRK